MDIKEITDELEIIGKDLDKGDLDKGAARERLEELGKMMDTQIKQDLRELPLPVLLYIRNLYDEVIEEKHKEMADDFIGLLCGCVKEVVEKE